ncbi:MAG: molybdopterin-guanine dinucleotide biosynthesis protein B [Betaproteobacteria bacterium]|nr:molybdopterin-guanine dinucleotide biosynthesis protein B [Betaproteobacteria bacterium]
MKTIAIAGYSGSGKTTLIEKVIPALVAEGLKVSLIKHAHHEFDIDQPGKDSWRHREAGASEVMVASRRRWALMHELRDEAEPALETLLTQMSPCDLVLVEGWKFNALPKIEVHRKLAGKPLLFPDDRNVVAIATDESLATDLPQFALDDGVAVAQFIVRHLALRRGSLHMVKGA